MVSTAASRRFFQHTSDTSSFITSSCNPANIAENVKGICWDVDELLYNRMAKAFNDVARPLFVGSVSFFLIKSVQSLEGAKSVDDKFPI